MRIDTFLICSKSHFSLSLSVSHIKEQILKVFKNNIQLFNYRIKSIHNEFISISSIDLI